MRVHDVLHDRMWRQFVHGHDVVDDLRHVHTDELRERISRLRNQLIPRQRMHDPTRFD